jgi:DNA-binding NarL/FixJ family response regulator
MHGSDESRRRAMEAGADVFLEKGSGSEKLVEAIRRVAAK